MYLQDLSTFQKEMLDRVLTRYARNDISLLELASDLPTTKPTVLSDFRNKMKEDFDTPLLSYINSVASDVRNTYMELLSVFAQGQKFFGIKLNLRQVLYNLSIWRMPVSLVSMAQYRIAVSPVR